MPLGDNFGGGLMGAINDQRSQGGMSPGQQALNQYGQGMAQMNQAAYNSALGAIGAQRNAALGGYGAASASAGRNYALTMQGIANDLRFGNQLRTQEQYRNVDLGRMRSALDLWRADRGFAISNADITRRVGFAGRGFNLANADTRAQYQTGTRNMLSDAVSRGARTAAGTLASSQDLVGQRTRGLAGNQLTYDTALSGLRTERQRAGVENTAAHRSYGIDRRTFDSLAKTYGIQFAQAAADAALARQRAAASRSDALGSARAGQASQLAGLAGAQQQAYSQYMQNQMGLFSQLLGAA